MFRPFISSAVVCIGMLATFVGRVRADGPVDALVPENDRIAQLERQVADLQRQVDALKVERAEAARLLRVVPSLPPMASMVPPVYVPPGVIPASPQPPRPGNQEHEINGVKFKLQLLSSQRVIR